MPRQCPNCDSKYMDEHMTTCIKCGHVTRPVVSIITKGVAEAAAKYSEPEEDDEEGSDEYYFIPEDEEE